MSVLQFQTKTDEQERIGRERRHRFIRNSRVASGYTVRNEIKSLVRVKVIAGLALLIVVLAVLAYIEN